MDKQLKQNFIQLPLNTFKKKAYPIPHFLFETKLQKSPKNLTEIKKLIESQQYEYIAQISQQRNLYCCKEKTNDRLVVIEIKQVGSKNNKNIYLSINLTPALKKDIRKYFMLKNWKILDKIYLQDQKGASGLVLLQYNFVEMDLRNLLKRQLELNEKITQQQITKICEDIIENLCYYHLQSIALLDIRPQTILNEDGKWFILNGDTSLTNKSTQFGSSMSKTIGFRPVTSLYLSPLMYESFIKNDLTLCHNPYKSDVYSLGLIIWQLLSIGTAQPMQIRNRLQNRKYSHVNNVKQEKHFNRREKIIIQNSKAYMVPNALRMMLQESQDMRNYIIEICLCLNFTSSLFAKILVPFEKFFRKQVIDVNSSSRMKIQYPHVGIQYEGDTLDVYDDLVRHGRGTVLHNNAKVFDGEWKNNLPYGKCSVNFSQVWNYEGMLEQGRLNGQGVLTFNGIRIGGTKWMNNLDEQIITNVNRQPQEGYYLISPQHNPMNNKKDHHQANNKRKSTIPLTNITNKKFLSTVQQFGQTKSWPEFGQQTLSCKSKLTQQWMINLAPLGLNYKAYFSQTHNNRSKYVINLSKVAEIQTSKMLQILINDKMFLTQKPQKIELFQNVKYELYESQNFDMIRIGVNRPKSNINIFDQIRLDQNKTQQSNKSQTYHKFINGYKMTNLQCTSKQFKKQFPLSEHNLLSTQFSNEQQSHLQFIEIVIPLSSGSSTLIKLLRVLSNLYSSSQPQNPSSFQKNDKSKFQTSLTKFLLPQLNLSFSSIMQDQFRQIIESNVMFSRINLSKCHNLNDNSMKHLIACQNVTKSIQGLNFSHTKITNKSLQELTFCDWLKKLNYLNISYCQKLTNDKIAQFLCDQKLSGLKQLEIAGLAINHRGLQRISQHCKLVQLQKLNIGACHQIGQLALLQVIKSKQLSNLKSLSCYSTTVKDIFLQTLSNEQSPLSRQIQFPSPELLDLNLSGSINLTIYGITKFFLSKQSKSIINLNLSNLDITDDFIQLLGKRNLLNPHICQLNLSACYKISDKGVKELLKSERLASLKKLDLSKTNVSNDTLFLLSQSVDRKLQILRLYKCCKMNDTGFEKFIMSPAIKNIKKLQMGGTSVKSIFFTTLVSEKAMVSIEELSLNQCQQIDQKSLCRLLCSKRISQIRLLDLSSTKISGKSLQALKHNPYLKSHLVHVMTQNCPQIKQEQRQSLCITNQFTKKMTQNQSTLKIKASQLSQSPILLKMTELELNNELQNVQKLFQSNYIINLSKLQIKWQQCSLSLKALSENAGFNSFKELSLMGSKFDENRLVQLLKTTAVKNIQTLNFGWTDITNETLGALASSTNLTCLRSLNLSKCSNFNDKGMVKLLLSSKASLLLNLDLRSTLITNTSLQTLGKSKNIKSLAKLILRSCPNITQAGFRQYFTSSNCSSLRQLDISWTRVSGNLFSYMSKSKSLQLNCIKISGLKGVQFQLCKFVTSLASSPLTQLEMNYTEITSQIIIALATSKYMQTLENIQLMGFDIVNSEQRFNSIKKYLQSPNINKISSLKFSFADSNEKISQKLFQTIYRNLLAIQKLSLIGANPSCVDKGKKILKKCQILHEQ